MPQPFQVTLPSSPSVFMWYCRTVISTPTFTPVLQLSDSDQLHFLDFNPEARYYVGTPFRYSLGTADGAITGTPFLQKGCGVGGQTTITVRMAGNAPSNNLRVACAKVFPPAPLVVAPLVPSLGAVPTAPAVPAVSAAVVGVGVGVPLAGGLQVYSDQNPTPASFVILSFPGNTCGDQVHSYTVLAGSWTGDITCSYQSTASVTQVAPVTTKMYAGYSDPYAITAADKLSKGAIAGIVVGSVVGFALIIVVCVLLLTRGGKTSE